MSNDKCIVLIYRIDIEIWVGWSKDYIKDGLYGQSTEVLNPYENVLINIDDHGKEHSIILNDYLNNVASKGFLSKEMIPCKLGTFLEDKAKNQDGKRQWRLLFSCLGDVGLPSNLLNS